MSNCDSICLRGTKELGAGASVPILPGYWGGETHPTHAEDYALFVTPLPPRDDDGTQAALWYYRGITRLLSVP